MGFVLSAFKVQCSLSVLGWAGKVLKTAIFAPNYLLFDLNARLTEETKRKKRGSHINPPYETLLRFGRVSEKRINYFSLLKLSTVFLHCNFTC